jgi:hypothetical protein
MGRKKRLPTPASIDAAQQIAMEIACQFGNFECDRSAIAIAKALGRDFDATFQRLATSDRSDVIALADRDLQISLSGVHVGIRIGGKIFDNLHPDGVTAGGWVKRFITATGAPLLEEACPLSAFYDTIFVRKRFLRWLFGARNR